MSLVYAFLADGSEEVEALAVIDILRRAKIDVVTVSINGTNVITSSHNITIKTDKIIEDIKFDEADLLFLPGGMPGTTNLAGNELLCKQLTEFNKQGKKLAAICAAPSILGELGILDEKNATCFPGFETKLLGANYTGEKVVTDGNTTTAKGLGAAIELGLELVKILINEEKATEIAKAIQLI